MDPTKDLIIDARKQSIKKSNEREDNGIRYISHQQVSSKVHHIPIPNRQRAAMLGEIGKSSQLS